MARPKAFIKKDSPNPFRVAADELRDHPGWEGFFEALDEMRRRDSREIEEVH